VKLAVGSRTDVGRARRRNEDSLLVQEPVFAVADGMGGHRGGDVASSMSVEELARAPVGSKGSPAILAAIKKANRALLRRGDAEPQLYGMGTTVTALVVDGAKGHILHVGDSRAYLLRDGKLRRLTEDHTVVQELVRQGRLTQEEADHHPQRSMITRALGVEDDVDVDELILDLHRLDRVVVCSDGLTAMLSEEEITEVLASVPDPQVATDRLVQLANEAGGEDNITVIVVDVLAVDEAPSDGEAQPVVAARVEVDPNADPNETAAIPAVDEAGEPVTEAGPDAAPKRRSRAARTIALVAIALLLAGLIGGYVGVRGFLNGQWYVGVSGSHVAVYQGVPASVLGMRLAKVTRVTPLSSREASRLQDWKTLSDGITARSEADANAIVERMRQELCRSQSSTCVPEPVT
jgi:serine/threonine protein phosphatase PrpC